MCDVVRGRKLLSIIFVEIFKTEWNLVFLVRFNGRY